MAGYSGTPLVKKLGIKPGQRVYLENAPADYADLVAPLPDDVTLTDRPTGKFHVAHLFVTQARILAGTLRKNLARIFDDGVIWVSWPKKAAKLPTDVTENLVRDAALPLGLVDIKVCAVDETWSGLKLVIRVENRAGTSRRA